MTVITKPLSEKKSDKLDEPLVVNIHTEFPQESKQPDAEKGAVGATPSDDPRLLVIRRHARQSSSATTVCLFLTAVLVTCCGIIAGVYLYRRFAFPQIHRFRGICRIPYDESGNGGLYNSPLQQDAALAHINEGLMEKFADKLYGRSHDKLNNNFIGTNSFREEFEIDTEDESYEKLTVPNFAGGRRSRFIHDFNSNKTGIIDLDGKRCFIMPLNRSQVLPPRDLYDLVHKMWSGYYEIDTSVLHETMRVVLPELNSVDASQLGVYIQKGCDGYPIYRLEKVVSGVYKRSISPSEEKFMAFSGKLTSYNINNYDQLLQHEKGIEEAKIGHWG